MAHIWQLQDAKNKFSEVIEDALSEGPQVITRRGKETAVILSISDYRRMLLAGKKLSQFFQDSPLVGLDLDLARDTSPLRDGIAIGEV
jgi:prevent-host-death family protein